MFNESTPRLASLASILVNLVSSRRSSLDVGLNNQRKSVSNMPPSSTRQRGRASRASSAVFAGGRIANRFALIAKPDGEKRTPSF